MINILTIDVDIGQINSDIRESVSNKIGCAVNRVPVYAYRASPGISAEYIRHGEYEQINLDHRYTTLDRSIIRTWNTRIVYEFACRVFAEYTQDHGDGCYDLVDRQNQIISHVIEDIIAHEYSHKVYFDRYFERIMAQYTTREGRVDRSLVEDSFDEAFTRWFHSIVVGHEHKSHNNSLRKVSTYELREKGLRPVYTDRTQIAMSYDLLVSISNEKGVKFVLENLADIANAHFEAIHSRRKKVFAQMVQREKERMQS